MVALVLLAALAATAKDIAKIKSPFVPSVTNGASGTFQMSAANNRAQVSIKAAGLVTNTDYQLLIGGVPEAEFNSGSKGKGNLKLLSSSTNLNQSLDMDPRGHVVSIFDGVTNVLALEVIGTNAPTNCVYLESTSLAPTTNAISTNAPTGTAALTYKVNRGIAAFTVALTKVQPGDYEIYSAGVLHGTNSVGTNSTSGKVTFSNGGSTNNLPLDFEPRGQTIDIVTNGATVFSGIMEAHVTNLTDCAFSLFEAPLIVNTNEQPNATGYARYITEKDCRRDFYVVVNDLNVGLYDFWVGGVLRGEIDVVSGSPNVGRIEFSTEVEDAYVELLDFDPTGQLIEIKQGTNVFFSGTGPLTATPTNLCDMLTLDVPLINQGVLGYPDAKGDARFRIHDDCDEDFRVVIYDLPADAYNLYVDSNKVAAISSGSSGALVEFNTAPFLPTQIPLTFDPRGKLIEVRKGSYTILSRVMPLQ